MSQVEGQRVQRLGVASRGYLLGDEVDADALAELAQAATAAGRA